MHDPASTLEGLEELEEDEQVSCGWVCGCGVEWSGGSRGHHVGAAPLGAAPLVGALLRQCTAGLLLHAASTAPPTAAPTAASTSASVACSAPR